MNEVINISLSQRANHVITHLYNNQESHIPYKKNYTVEYENSVFLSTFRSRNGTTNYSPRAILYDLNGGFGSLSKYEYHEPKPSIDVCERQIIKTKEQLKKNEYQINLDKGINKSDTLNVENTKYWTDYNKLIYSPRSLNSLNNWNLSESEQFGADKHFSNFLFNTFNLGQEEFNEDIESHLDTFRRYLEECDLIQGLNVLTEIDSSWGGFTNELLVNLKDEFFNNGVNNKYNIWIYGLMDSDYKPRLNQLYSRIKTMVELSKNSTLFFPMNLDTESSLLNENFNKQSLWHSSSLSSIFINSIWGLNNQYLNPKRMSLIEDNLLRGYNKRNIINEIKINKIDAKDNSIQDVDIIAYYQSPQANLQQQTTKDSINLGISKIECSKYFIKNFIVPANEELINSLNTQQSSAINIYENKKLNDIVEVDTFPNILPTNKLYTEFNVTYSFKDDLKLYKKILSSVRPGNEVVDDKFELIEEISELIEQYSMGYDDSDEDFD